VGVQITQPPDARVRGAQLVEYRGFKVGVARAGLVVAYGMLSGRRNVGNDEVFALDLAEERDRKFPRERAG
jgi:hypothetical protein